MSKHAKIITFIKESLGCGCPDKVFEKIESSRIILQDSRPKAHRIVVGDTLLVYICADWPVAELNNNLYNIITTAKSDRDNNQYNRFRLVLNARDTSQQRILQENFNQATAGDKKLHLHFIDNSELQRLLQN